MELSSAVKAQNGVGWDDLMWGQIALHWNQWQIVFIKEFTSRKMGINQESSFIEKLLQLGHA